MGFWDVISILALLATFVLLLIGIIFLIIKKEKAKKVFNITVIVFAIAIGSIILGVQTTSTLAYLVTFSLLIMGIVLYFKKNGDAKKMSIKKMRILKITGYIALAVFFLIAGGIMGANGSDEVTLNGKIISKRELNQEISQLNIEKEALTKEVKAMEKEKKETVVLIDNKKEIEAELSKTQEKIEDTKRILEKELAEGQKVIKENLVEAEKAYEKDKKVIEKKLEEAEKVYEKDKKVIDGKLATASKDLKVAQAKVIDVNGKVLNSEAKLASVSVDILKAIEEPKYLNPGQYVIGKDIPIGRYTVTPEGRGTNFFIYGEMPVNTILGRDNTASYTFFASEGDIIETLGSVKLTPIDLN